jgi:hypothetical protein
VRDLRFKPLSLEHGWQANTVPSPPPGYAIDSDGIVHLRGWLSGAAAFQTGAFTLPPAARPAHSWFELVWAGLGDDRGYADIHPDGTVHLEDLVVDPASQALLNGVTFAAK